MKYRTIIVGVHIAGEQKSSSDEITGLAVTAGASILASVSQNIKKINPSSFIGEGKIEEIRELINAHKANLIIIDCELSGSQQNNLEQKLGIQVLDRTALILDIFSQRARTKEGKIQVELAQLNFISTRLKGKGVMMSRLAGGIGTRGPGESKLETDRRKIRERITKLAQELKHIEKNRSLHRQYREKREVPQIAIIGYTNAGKSTLLNKLTSAEVLVEDKLFATLDPTTRKLKLSGKKFAILTDTVGFIEKLPHHLVKAFRSTFEEIKEADLIFNVIDISNPLFHEQSVVVQDVLNSMDIAGIPILNVYNKIDSADIGKDTFLRYPKLHPSVMVSAREGAGIVELLDKTEKMLSGFWANLLIKVAAPSSWLISTLLASGTIIRQEDHEGFTIIDAEVPNSVAEKIKKVLAKEEILT
ncbi:MAG: GTPase HflX [Oligoflexia bacterium]|nr:GTPase HflX [Oligoflexia bacterium]